MLRELHSNVRPACSISFKWATRKPGSCCMLRISRADAKRPAHDILSALAVRRTGRPAPLNPAFAHPRIDQTGH
ncbi:hypothetical protein WT49_23290 [Burkholderia territorii]|nr:hypothetical protein WT49_23290 [Burkholderia territorii]KWE33055.1 hypothetical protein WT50_28425 [Burkholderia territorii]KWE56136.1 hypothetical protein WT51_03530 [Burkholderia territorii]